MMDRRPGWRKYRPNRARVEPTNRLNTRKDAILLVITGQLRGDARTGDSVPIVLLRETKRYWITKYGVKYRKDNGRPAGNEPWPLWHLDLETVRPI